MSGPEALFELTMLGGAVERRYRRLRPEVERLPWASLDPGRYDDELLARARRTWTEAAFQEHRTAAACAATLQHLIAARAPVDLVAMASRFPLDELVHVELCARLAEALGGGAPLLHDPTSLVELPAPHLPLRLQAAELVVRNFCVGEALSIPVLRASWHAARQPLIKAILGRIVKDEAAHGQFGWIFLDWASDELSHADRAHLAGVAAAGVRGLLSRWEEMKPGNEDADADRMGWMESRTYLTHARSALRASVLAPLLQFGIDVEVALSGERGSGAAPEVHASHQHHRA